MKPRFTKYGNHQPQLVLHADVSEKLKKWAQENEDAFTVFLLDPELFVGTIITSVLKS